MIVEGQQLGEFTILERLDQGGMGAVYKARQPSLDRVVALKTLHAGLADDPEYLGRFLQEAKAAAKLSHPNLVQVYSAGNTDGISWFAMEYVEGESAKGRLRRHARLDAVEAIAITIHVASALDYCWRKASMVHRDVKPENIFLSADGEVKLGDLGLAKSSVQSQATTAAGLTMGTPLYMSPEQAEGKSGLDFRTDIYSLGCTLYHLLCGVPPYAGDSAAAVMLKQINAPVPDLRSAWPECPNELAGTVRKMMQKEPADRPQSYEEVSASLHRIYRSLSGEKLPVEKEIRRWPLSTPWLAGLGTAAAGAGLLCLVVWRTHGASPSIPPLGGLPPPPLLSEAGALKDGSPLNSPASSSLADLSLPLPEPVLSPPGETEASKAQIAFVSMAASILPDVSGASSSADLPKASAEVEKWFAQVDAPQQEAFQKQVLKPYEAALADLRGRYSTAIDSAITKASAAGQLSESLVWRSEKQAFDKAKTVAEDTPESTAEIKTLRAAFRLQLAKIDQDRIVRAKASLGKYDAILAQYQTLTQRQRFDDALLLKTKRDEIALAWLEPSPLIAIDGTKHVEAGKPMAVTTTQVASTGTPSIPPSSRSVTPAQVADSAPKFATKDRPFVNTLGMTFVPVPIIGGQTGGKRVLFSIWDTRVQDFAAFVEATKHKWELPNFDQGPTHPAVNMTWEDAQLFCEWLTKREQEAGRLPVDWSYRLPTDHEWSCAVGLGTVDSPTKSPADKSGSVPRAYPWGSKWPPPENSGNYASEELTPLKSDGRFKNIKGVITGYRDGYVTTSPVGAFPANTYGLYDVGGNARQWCEDWFDKGKSAHVVRGSSWAEHEGYQINLSFRQFTITGTPHLGFRCVLSESHH